MLKKRLGDAEDHYVMMFRKSHLFIGFPFSDHLYQSCYKNEIPAHLKVLSALRFHVGQEALQSMSQACVSYNIFEVSLFIKI